MAEPRGHNRRKTCLYYFLLIMKTSKLLYTPFRLLGDSTCDTLRGDRTAAIKVRVYYIIVRKSLTNSRILCDELTE